MNKNTAVLVSTTVGSIVMRFVSSLILTRLLVPESFALVGMVASFMMVFELLSDVGFRSYILQLDKINVPDLISNLWTIQVIRGVALCILFCLCAGYIEQIFIIEGLAYGLILSSPYFLIRGIVSLSPILEEKKNLPSKPILCEFSATVVSSLIVIVSTFYFKNVWCVLLGTVWASIIYLVLSYSIFPKLNHRFLLKRDYSLGFFHWSKFIVPSSILTILIGQSDKLMLGRAMSSDELGLYFIALNLTGIGMAIILNFSNKLISPAMSIHIGEDTKVLTKHFYEVKHQFLCFTAALLGMLTGFSGLIVVVLYDPRYLGISAFMPFLLTTACFMIYSRPHQALLIVKGFARSTLVANIIRTITIFTLAYPLYSLFDYWGLLSVFVLAELNSAIYWLIKSSREGHVSYFQETQYIFVFLLTMFISYICNPSLINLATALGL